MTIDALRAHDRRVSEIMIAYRRKVLDVHDALSSAINDRDEKIEQSWQQYLEESKDE